MEPAQYLASSEYIDWQDENVLAKAKSLAEPSSVITETLTRWTTYQEMLGNLPDIEWG